MVDIRNFTDHDGYYCSKELTTPYRELIITRYTFDDSLFTYLYSLEKGNSSCIIYLPGSGYDSILGSVEGDIFRYSFFALLCNELKESYDIAAVEKFNLEPLEKYGAQCSLDKYSIDNIIKYNSKIIEDYLSENSQYEKIYLLGVSEGGKLLPLLYKELKARFPLKKMVMLSSGSLSHKDELLILKRGCLPLPELYKEELEGFTQFLVDFEKERNSLNKCYLGEPYFRWNQFLNYSSLPLLLELESPILVIHGAKDIYVPIESARAVVKSFKSKGKRGLTYMEIDEMGHRPEEEEHIKMIFYSIENFLKEPDSNK